MQTEDIKGQMAGVNKATGEGAGRTILEGVSTHNLKNVDVVIPHRAVTVISGVSGSGKSSLAFDTLYAEGQRRFVESLSTYARQFLRRMERPPITRVQNIQPAVALQQKNSIKNARSTVSSLTELGDHLQLLFSHIGVAHCPRCDAEVRRESLATVSATLEGLGEGHRLIFVAQVPVLDVETPQQVLDQLVAGGHRRLFIDGAQVNLGDAEIDGLLDRDVFPVIVDRIKLAPGQTLRLREAIEHGFRLGRDKLEVFDVTDPEAPTQHKFDKHFRCNACGETLIEPIPQLFSPNSPIGACTVCSGFGRTAGLDMDKVVANPRLSLEEGAVSCFETKGKVKQRRRLLEKARQKGIATDVPFRLLPKADKAYLLEGGRGYSGVRGYFARLQKKRHKPQVRILIARYRGYTRCEQCKGSRLSPMARAVTLDGDARRTINDLTSMRVREARAYFEAPDWSASDLEKVEPLLFEIRTRLEFLNKVGLEYLTLDRPSRTLSGGEVQRIHLTSSIGRMLTDTLYVLDEPTAGLHPRDSLLLLEVLHALRDIGNTVVVVEHDPDIIQGADHVIELGPHGGERGGNILYEGDVPTLMKAETPTGHFLRARHLERPEETPSYIDQVEAIVVRGACVNNLQDITVRFPLGHLTCVTGVSGSGKSSLVHRCLYEHWRRYKGIGGVEAGNVEGVDGFDLVDTIVLMGQGGMGRSKRSTVVSYCKAWDGIRKTFGGTRRATQLGLGAGDFSFNRPGGRCERCEGTGTILIEMHFMADIEIICDACEGKRFQSRVLGVEYKDRNIDDVLKMTVTEAHGFFHTTGIRNKLAPLIEVGLGYLRLGQTTSTLSGGEAQRLLLASYLGKKTKDHVAFIFDEPTVGLHLRDVEVLLGALRQVVDEGHTVIVVEHNTDFIANADHIIDLGPEGGDGGGRIVAEGTPFDVAEVPGSYTGQFLAEILIDGEEGRVKRPA